MQASFCGRRVGGRGTSALLIVIALAGFRDPRSRWC
jgi:hypothetical protein